MVIKGMDNGRSFRQYNIHLEFATLLGEMKKAETMKTMTSEEVKVYAWKESKTRNLRALLCSSDTVIWPDSRWKQCNMFN